VNCIKLGNINRVRGTLDIIVRIGFERDAKGEERLDIHHATWDNWQEVLKAVFTDNGIPWSRYKEFGKNMAYLEF
jgi:hypothetical protein